MKKTLPGALAAGALVLVSFLLSRWITPELLEYTLAGLGPWAAAAYIGLFALLPAFFFPVAVLALAGGLLFGLCKGAL